MICKQMSLLLTVRSMIVVSEPQTAQCKGLQR